MNIEVFIRMLLLVVTPGGCLDCFSCGMEYDQDDCRRTPELDIQTCPFSNHVCFYIYIGDEEAMRGCRDELQFNLLCDYNKKKYMGSSKSIDCYMCSELLCNGTEDTRQLISYFLTLLLLLLFALDYIEYIL